MRKIYPVICIAMLILSTAVQAQTFSLVKDIRPGVIGSVTNMLWETLSINGNLYVQADDGVHGTQLWKSDGTEAGTFILKDMGVQSGGGVRLTDVNGTLYFMMYDQPLDKLGLWKSDGTETGTVKIKDFDNPHNSDFDFQLQNLTNVNGTLYFSVGILSNGAELWKSDGTSAGTVMVKDIVTGTGSSRPRNLTNVNGTLYFTATTTANGREIWKSDGTSAGTVLVKNVNPGTADSDARDFNYVNGTTIFFANSGGGAWELWKTDGTDAGTELVKNISAFDLTTFYQLPYKKATIGNTFYFAGNGAEGTELWKTDGTTAGTVLVKDINPGSAGSGVVNMAVINGVVLFLANDGTHGNELWKSDGTEAGTVMIKDINPGPTAGSSGNSGNIVTINDKIFFVANDGVNGTQPWRSDGTEAGTYMMENLVPASGSPVRIAAAGSKFFLNYQDNTVGREIFVATIPVSAPLPLTMINVGARLVGENGVVSWKTTLEENTSHFEIERSLDNRKYSKVGTVASSNIIGVHDYSFTDPHITSLNKPVVFYRLKLVDQDGKFAYSKTFAINISDEKPVIMLYPTPAHESATIMIAVRRRENLTVSVVDMNGKVVQQKRIIANEGSNLVPLETGSLSSGIYTVMINGEMINSSTRLVKQ